MDDFDAVIFLERAQHAALGHLQAEQLAQQAFQNQQADFASFEEARAVIEALSRDSVYDLPIVTTVEPNATFWPAESNHDRYYRRHPFQPYCLAVIAPKVAKLRARHADKLRD